MARDDAERWDQRWRERAGEPAPAPAEFLTGLAARLPHRGRALDVAGGRGRNAVWLAARGLEVTLVDASQVALELAGEAARAAGVRLGLEPLDLDRVTSGEAAFPAGPWDLVLCHHFLCRALPDLAAPATAAGGLLLICQPTRRNLERHPHPSAAWLLEEGELAGLVGPEWEVLELSEGWTPEGRHEARLVARRRPAVAAPPAPP